MSRKAWASAGHGSERYGEAELVSGRSAPGRPGGDDAADRRTYAATLQDQAGGGKQGEGLASPLGVPDEAPALPGLGAAFDDAVHCPALVLA